VTEVCEHCFEPLWADDRVVQATGAVITRTAGGDVRPLDGVVVFVHEDHWTENNPRGWREIARGKLKDFRPVRP
jgi:hypothetical protein